MNRSNHGIALTVSDASERLKPYHLVSGITFQSLLQASNKLFLLYAIAQICKLRPRLTPLGLHLHKQF